MDIQLIDNTAPAERPADDAPVYRTNTTTSTGSRLWSRSSIRAGRTRRKYAKWQPDRLGVAEDSATDGEQLSSDERELGRAETNANTLANTSTIQESSNNNGYQSDSQPSEQNAEPIQQQDFGAVARTQTTQTTHQSKDHPKICGLKPESELDILYENQRGWFFFGIPLYSDRSLLNLDPSPWINKDGKRSIVNITNAQVPDPSWEWAWRTWYVDMSGDVDEQGWQYAFSFASSSWHGTHPFFHSFVRRRRWVRLRVKRASKRHRQNRTGLEMAHLLNADYFTIHSAVKPKRGSSSERPSRAMSVNLTHKSTGTEEEVYLEEIRNIPSLMYALKTAIVDREKLDAVTKFIEEGGDELYYLDSTIPEIMAKLVYQISRWQLFTHLKDTLHQLSQEELQGATGNDKEETEALKRKQEYLAKAVETAQRHVTGAEVLQVTSESYTRASASELLEFAPGSRRESLSSRISGRYSFEPMDNGGEIKGIPRKAQIGHDMIPAPMLSRGGRHIKKCGLSAGFGDQFAVGQVSVADEPLLFLYPRWFTSISQQRRRPLSTTVSKKRIHPCASGELSPCPRASHPQHHHRSLAASSGQRWLSTSSTPMQPKIDTAPERPSTSTRPSKFDDLLLVGQSGKFDAFAGLYTEDDGSSDPLIEQPRPVLRLESRQRHRRAASEGSIPSSCLSLSRLTWAEGRRMRSRDFWMRRYGPKEHASVYGQLKKMVLAAERRARFRISRGISLDAKDDLHTTQILVPEETIALLCGPSWASTGSETVNENIWFVQLHNGCRNRKILLTGSNWVTKLVEGRIKQTQELQEKGDVLIDIQKPPVPVFPSIRALNRDGLSAPLVRAASLDLVTSGLETVSTVRSFVEHVDGLASSLPIPNNRQDRNKVARALSALNKAISFLLKYKYLSYAQALIVRGEHAAAKEQNIPLLFQVMRIVTRLRMRPNSDTLLAYLSCLNHPASRTKMVRFMEAKGYLRDPTVMRQVMQLKGKSVNVFISKIVRAMGRSYLSAPLINRMFHITVHLKKPSAMKQLLELCKVNGIIQFFQHDTFSALDYTLKCLEMPKSKLDRRAYEALFLNAFENRHYNICRVLWWYACMDRMITRQMKWILTSRAEQGNMWRSSAGTVILGIDLRSRDYPLKQSLLKDIPVEFHDNPVASLMGNTEGKAWISYKRAASAILEHDIKVGSWYRPKLPLANMLEAAAVLDMQWKDVPRTRTWLMQNAIQVPLKLVGHDSSQV
ncbi:hypothetical protein BJX64DRAFT_274355 [Aspergillus heterothallicus]